MCEGIVAELETVDLGDKRRNDRSRQLLELLAADPAASVNASCPNWSETLGAYRLLKNQHVRPEDILSAHSEKTMERIEQEPVVLVIQDTTTLNYTKHPPRDALLLDSDDQFGLYDHTHLTCTPEGLPLGVVGVEFFGRTPETLGKTSERKADPIETKESYRWLKGYHLANDIQQRFPDKTIVSIGDREGDLYDIYLAAAETPNSADYVFRLKSPRSTLEQDPTAGKHAYQKVRKCVEESTVIATQTVTLPRTPKRKERTATLEIRAMTLTVKPPHARSYMGPVQMNFVSVIEIGRPADDLTAVNWFLGTSLPIDSVANVLKVVKYYRKRWTIEVYTR
ncbi:MAG: IS4 family transposase, partial [Caldilineaceae bacterium]|nr:IS4 family transposase [Caldilineaceae bacterium]